MKVWAISIYFIEWIGLRKTLSFSLQAFEALKFWIFTRIFIGWIGCEKIKICEAS